MKPRLTAIITACVRSFAFSLERMLRMCPLTVSSEIFKTVGDYFVGATLSDHAQHLNFARR